jgi:hypothetical protein
MISPALPQVRKVRQPGIPLIAEGGVCCPPSSIPYLWELASQRPPLSDAPRFEPAGGGPPTSLETPHLGVWHHQSLYTGGVSTDPASNFLQPVLFCLTPRLIATYAYWGTPAVCFETSCPHFPRPIGDWADPRIDLMVRQMQDR